jgi:hypothetical protein
MPMKVICRALALALLLAPAAYAVKIPIPIDGATLNVSIQIQTQMQVNQNGAPDGTSASFDIYMRRTRLLVNGDISQNFTYLLQIDNANFGKFGNFAPRAIVQDAWVGWAPGGITGGTVVYIDAGILLIPISHHLLESTTNFIAADVQTDAFRFPGNNWQGLRDTGIQLRGWAFDKKVGFRGGVYEGNTPATVIIGGAPANINSNVTVNNLCNPNPPGGAGNCITPKRNPMFGGYLGINLIGSEEGGWLYGAYKWGKDPIWSIGFADNYQSMAVRNFGNNNLNDQNVFAANTYLNMPLGGEAAELVFEGTFYLNSNGGNTANTGIGASGGLGLRFGKVGPYVAYDYFSSQDCDVTAPGVAGTSAAALANQAACRAGRAAGTPHSADTREAKVGLTYWFNKNVNHMNLEFISSHGQSTYGAGAITAGTAGYAPLALDPIAPSTARRTFKANLYNQALWTILYHWNVFF